MELPEVLRSRYTNLRILADQEHTVNPDGGQLLSFLQCFPNVQTASISWKVVEIQAPPSLSLRPTVGSFDGLKDLGQLEILEHPDDYDKETFELLRYGVYDLLDLFRHLPLSHLRDLGIFFEAFADSFTTAEEMFWYLEEFGSILKSIRFASLESIHLGFNFNVFRLPSFEIWEFLEELSASMLEATLVTAISFRFRLLFDCADDIRQDVLTKTNEDVKLHPAYLPPRNVLIDWVRRIKTRHPQVTTVKLCLEYSTFDTYLDKVSEYKSILEFNYCKANADAGSYRRPPIRQNMDLRSQHAGEETDSCGFRYMVYPEAISACYDQLVREDEEIRQEEAREEADLQFAMAAHNGEARVENEDM